MNSSHDKHKILRYCFYLSWLLLSLLQANYTELLADEAYYWKYAQNLSWGYFDHPPMVAVFIKAGYGILHNELGVRLLFVFGSVGFLYLLELLTRPKRLALFYMSIASVGAFHFLGFLALPDLPLLLFSVLFLYLYRQYLQQTNLWTILSLSITTTLLLLSKYHGILVIGFTVLANPTLLKKRSFWLITIISTLLFLPHIQWQLQHHLPSLKYHLSERSSEPYHIEFTLNYLLSTLLMFSPIAGIVFAWQALKKRPGDIFSRTLFTLLAGTLVFFFIMSFKGRIEANWVAIALIPAVVSGYSICEEKMWFPRFMRYTFWVSLVLILILRIGLVADLLPDTPQFHLAKIKLHGTPAWAKDIEHKADGRPVVFMNKYQYAAWYEYYTGQPAISLNNRMGRKNQYNIWDDEYRLQGKDIMLIPNYYIPGMDSIVTAKGTFQYYFINNFRSSSPVQIIPQLKEVIARPGEEIEVGFNIQIPEKYQDKMNINQEYRPSIHALIFKDGKRVSDLPTGMYIQDNMFNSNEVYTVKVPVPQATGSYQLYLDISMGNLPPSINGKKITLEVL